MAAMGLTLTFEEITNVFTRSPQLLLLGMVLQYTVLPSIGWAISRFWGLPASLAIGVALVSGPLSAALLLESCSTTHQLLASPTFMEAAQALHDACLRASWGIPSYVHIVRHGMPQTSMCIVRINAWQLLMQNRQELCWGLVSLSASRHGTSVVVPSNPQWVATHGQLCARHVQPKAVLFLPLHTVYFAEQVSCMPGGTASNIVAYIARGDMVSKA